MGTSHNTSAVVQPSCDESCAGVHVFDPLIGAVRHRGDPHQLRGQRYNLARAIFRAADPRWCRVGDELHRHRRLVLTHLYPVFGEVDPGATAAAAFGRSVQTANDGDRFQIGTRT